MIPRVLFSVLLTLCCFIPESYSLIVKTKPSPTVVMVRTTPTLMVRCQVSQENTATVEMIKLSFNNTSSNKKEIAIVRTSSASITDSSIRDRGATINGRILSAGSYLKLSITNVTCADVGSYTCEVGYTVDGSSNTTKEQTTVEGRSYSGLIEILLDPIKDKYLVGETITVKCQGDVGKPPGNWTWQMEERGTWKPYTVGVTQDSASVTSQCAYYRTTSFQYTVVDQIEKKFRCIVNSDVDTAKETAINGHVSGATILTFSTSLSIFCFILSIW